MGEVVKINPKTPTTPEVLLGELLGCKAKIKSILAVVVWENDVFQPINTAMRNSDYAFALRVLGRKLDQEIDQNEWEE